MARRTGSARNRQPALRRGHHDAAAPRPEAGSVPTLARRDGADARSSYWPRTTAAGTPCSTSAGPPRSRARSHRGRSSAAQRRSTRTGTSGEAARLLEAPEGWDPRWMLLPPGGRVRPIGPLGGAERAVAARRRADVAVTDRSRGRPPPWRLH
ncbi:hypothetical protein HBB16_18025 [Pseudonocardia sp. MCCB 268]|nr:hypothetical protein [Pseudonocardia cytotoxica]